MSDSGSGGNQFVAEAAQTVKEVAGDVNDAVGEMVEQGVQSTFSSAPTPQQVQQKQQQDQADLVKVRKQIAWMKNVDAEQKQVAAANKQKEAQRIETQHQQSQTQPGEVVAPSHQTAKPQVAEEVKRTMTEIKQGKGVGG
jgi:hypothetical protein